MVAGRDAACPAADGPDETGPRARRAVPVAVGAADGAPVVGVRVGRVNGEACSVKREAAELSHEIRFTNNASRAMSDERRKWI